MRLTVPTTLAAVLAFIASDAAANRKPDLGQPEYLLEASSGKGLMVVAMRMPWFRSGHPKNARWQLSYAGPSGKNTRARVRTLTLEHENYITGRNIASDYGDEVFGVVFVVELPAGAYALSGWYLDGNTTTFNMGSAGATLLPFRVQSGRATYVGNLEMTLETGRNLLGIEGLRDASVVLTDESPHDLAIFLRKYPKVTSEQIDVQVTFDPTWQHGPTRKQRELSPIIPIPIPTPQK